MRDGVNSPAPENTHVAGDRPAPEIANLIAGSEKALEKSLRVGEDVAVLAPHRPERARFAHSVLHGTDWLTSGVAMDDPRGRQRVGLYQRNAQCTLTVSGELIFV